MNRHIHHSKLYYLYIVGKNYESSRYPSVCEAGVIMCVLEQVTESHPVLD